VKFKEVLKWRKGMFLEMQMLKQMRAARREKEREKGSESEGKKFTVP